MSKMQKNIIISIILVIILIMAILILILSRRLSANGINEYTYIEEVEPKTEISVVDTRNNFYIVKDCINKYYTYCSIISDPKSYYGEIEEEMVTEAKNENAKIIYNILDEEYIKDKGINTNNIINKIEKTTASNVDINRMYVSEKTTNMSVYIVLGTLRDKVSNKITPFKMIVKLDFANETFSLLPQDYVEKEYPNVENEKTIKIEVPENIKVNANNKYIAKIVSEQTYIVDLFEQYKEELLYNQQAVYDNLDEAYRKAKFSNVLEFEQYIKNRYNNINALQLKSYSKTSEEKYTKYVLLAEDGEYYIFLETAPMKYTLILDTYTIEIPEFTERYDASNPQEKVILNLNKFMQAINNKDYKYAYSILAESFKQANFKTQAEFENYAKTHFFEKNEFKYEKFSSEANTYYTYQIKVTDKEKKQNQEITKTFIVLLEERKRIPVII